MLFITNRIPNQSARSKKNRAISFNYQNTDISKWLYFCERHDVGDYTEILSTPFFARLKALPDTTQILFYLHGFNNNMESSFAVSDTATAIDNDGKNKSISKSKSKSDSVFTRTAQLQALLDKQQPGCWSSRLSGLVMTIALAPLWMTIGMTKKLPITLPSPLRVCFISLMVGRKNTGHPCI
ncbi:hypothetical protein [Vibrio methylphosphonaticus]|uniref:hypothetical protein n=1 Tax=Vibrio methylphosphonaticus TaxID=2946866 RepID=UPI00202A059A|nr:hypothetical protein [Vibrio methylphosphonaticus]MCL9775506.1 hypothetical protein [Vibrio methylphosphonaticus]